MTRVTQPSRGGAYRCFRSLGVRHAALGCFPPTSPTRCWAFLTDGGSIGLCSRSEITNLRVERSPEGSPCGAAFDIGGEALLACDDVGVLQDSQHGNRLSSVDIPWGGTLAHPRSCRVLMVYPRFVAETFWNFADACKLMGARYPAAPLGLITVAAMLPQTWDVRLVNRNTEELTDEDCDWADLVMTGGMLPQQADTLFLINMCRAHNKPVVVGGPDATSSPHIYRSADFRVLGEAEGIINEFITAWEAGHRSGTFVAPKFDIDVTKSPIPRFDLLKFDHYLYIGVQYSRGCPFTCEFCDIIELYGRVPRSKATPQILRRTRDALCARLSRPCRFRG